MDSGQLPLVDDSTITHEQLEERMRKTMDAIKKEEDKMKRRKEEKLV